MDKIGLTSLILTICVAPAFGVEQIVLAPLFEYPVPPDEIEALPLRSDWMMDNFWKPMDFGSRQTIEQARVNHAFEVYAIAMQWANKDKVTKSVAELLKKLKKNPTLAVQFTLAAEENLYGPRASFWIDEVYKNFLVETLKINKIPTHLRNRWKNQLETLTASEPGKKAPELHFIDKDGGSQRYFAMSTPTVLIFADSKDPNIRLDILRSETDTELTRLLTQGKLNIIFIDPNTEGADITSLPERWIGGKLKPDVKNPYDTRVLPTVYLIGPDTKILSRQYSIPMALTEIIPICNGKISNQLPGNNP